MGRKVDISELYNLLSENRESYVLVFDVVGLDPVNKNLGRKAGDGVISEAFRRIDEMAGDNMTVFRIGGDEFALVTGLTDSGEVEKTAQRVISQNGNTISCDGKEIPVAVRTGAMKLAGEGAHSLRYGELFDRLQNVVNNSKDESKVNFIS